MSIKRIKQVLLHNKKSGYQHVLFVYPNGDERTSYLTNIEYEKQTELEKVHDLLVKNNVPESDMKEIFKHVEQLEHIAYCCGSDQ